LHAEKHIAPKLPAPKIARHIVHGAPVTRLTYGDRKGPPRWHSRRGWKEWAPFIIVAVLSVSLLLVLALTAPVFRPLPIPGSRSSKPSHFDRLAELVGFIADSTEQSEVESAELKASAKDSI
jgi:hypothetical protein